MKATLNTTVKNGLIIAGMVLLGVVTHAQDVITYTDGRKVEAKVQEITSNTIKYKKYNNPTGPLYTVRHSEVYKITYESGDVETYTVPRGVSAGSKELKPKDLSLDKKGIFIEGLAGFTVYTHTRTTQDYYYDQNGYGSYSYSEERVSEAIPTIGMRLGSKFYFGNPKKKYNQGLQMGWLSVHAYLQEGAGVNFGLLNPGYTGILKFNEETGMEFNLGTGFNIVANDFGGDTFGFLPLITVKPALGYNINPGIKFRHKGFGLGLEYNYAATVTRTDNPTYSTVNLTIGRKF